jgi:hypothetical protein
MVSSEDGAGVGSTPEILMAKTRHHNPPLPDGDLALTDDVVP